ncbi:MAG: helix-turn-helix transcriptional regulator [Lachnospiraceae bacterium]|nr:helix-turn-helix transcriptional regulator [Lachnospiraceae bacterium]
MDQKKIGSFLKELRKQKGITQEELAEQLNVSGRTVSRWETGNNMPDISILIELAELYDVSIPEIVNGERKNESMNEEVKEVAQSLSDYADLEKENMLKEVRSLSITGVVALLLYGVLGICDISETYFMLGTLSTYCLVLVIISPIMILFYTSGLISKVKKRKNNKILLFIIEFIVVFVLALLFKSILTMIGV